MMVSSLETDLTKKSAQNLCDESLRKAGWPFSLLLMYNVRFGLPNLGPSFIEQLCIGSECDTRHPDQK